MATPNIKIKGLPFLIYTLFANEFRRRSERVKK